MMFRVPEGVEEFRHCLVCSDKITAMHLGMDTCRACSSFFKRTKSLDRQYPCRQGDRKCAVNKESKFTCRRCRFDKCLAIGMEYDGPMRIRTKKPVALLERIEVEYKAFMDRRKAREMQLLEPSGSFTRIPHPREVLYVNKPTDPINNDLFSLTVEETYRFFKRIFPTALNNSDLELIFKEFVGAFIMIEYQQRTRRVFGDNRKFLMCSAITCFERSSFLAREEGDSLNDETLKSSVRSYAEDDESIILPIFLKARISDKEFFALIALLMSEIDEPSQFTPEILEVLDEIRRSVFRELQTYYRNDMGIIDFSVRLGNLMTLNHAMQECKSLFQAYFRFYMTIFDDQTIDENMKNLFL